MKSDYKEGQSLLIKLTLYNTYPPYPNPNPNPNIPNIPNSNLIPETLTHHHHLPLVINSQFIRDAIRHNGSNKLLLTPRIFLMFGSIDPNSILSIPDHFNFELLQS